MSDDGLQRRDVLRRGAATVGAATLASLAGCSGVTDAVPFVGGDASYDWFPEPDYFDGDHYEISRLDLRTIRNNEENLDSDTYSFFESFQDRFEEADIDFEDMNTHLSIVGNAAVSGSFDNGTIRSNLADSDADFDDSEYEGYTIYYSEDAAVAYAVGDWLLRTRPISEDDPQEVAEHLIDTKKGNEDRYTDDSEDMAKLLDVVGSPTFVSGGTQEEPEEPDPEGGRFENSVAKASTVTVNGQRSRRTWVRVFEDQSDVDTGAFEDWIDAREDERFSDVENLDINQQGRAVVVNGRSDTDEI